MGLSYNETKRLLDLIWPEMEAELTVWIDQLREILEDSNDSVTMKEIHQAQGSLRALRNVLQLPETLLSQKDLDEENADEQ